MVRQILAGCRSSEADFTGGKVGSDCLRFPSSKIGTGAPSIRSARGERTDNAPDSLEWRYNPTDFAAKAGTRPMSSTSTALSFKEKAGYGLGDMAANFVFQALMALQLKLLH